MTDDNKETDCILTDIDSNDYIFTGIDTGITTLDCSTDCSTITFSSTDTITFTDTITCTDNIIWSDVNYIDPYVTLEKHRLEKEEDEELRNRYPSLQEAYDNYQLIKKLVEDNEIDKSFEKRYEDFKVK